MEGQRHPNMGAFVANREGWEQSAGAINQSEILLMINTFRPFQTAGTDETVPALLQQRTEHLVAHLCHTIRTCPVRRYIHKACRQVRVTFIPKSRNANYTKATAYCPINLLYFMSKT